MKLFQTLAACFLLAASIPVPSRAASSASLTIEIASGQDTRNPVVHVTLKNLSAAPLHITSAGAFFDYQCRVTDAKGHPVRMTKEGLDIRNGHGVIVTSAAIIALNQNETQQQDLDLARYFDLSGGGPYRLVLVRVLDNLGERITSNALDIRTK